MPWYPRYGLRQQDAAKRQTPDRQVADEGENHAIPIIRSNSPYSIGVGFDA